MTRPGGMGLILALLAAAPVAAQDDWNAPPPAWEGVWQGTIGTLSVHLCLDTTPSRSSGAYYYDRHRSLIPLELDDSKVSWIEKSADDRDGPRWRIAAGGKDALTGSWTDGKAMLPVRMRRIGPTSADYEGPCESMEFHRPRLKPVALTRKSTTKYGAALTIWTFRPGAPFGDVEVSSFTLDRPGPAVARVNALLRAILPKADGGGNWLDCIAGSANAHGMDGNFSESIEPSLVAGRWLGATYRSDTYCGGAHPNTSLSYRTFDLEKGAEVDPLDWFAPTAVLSEQVDKDSLKSLAPAFRKFLLANYKAEDEECDGVLADAQYWSVGIERGSMVFWPELPRVVMACSEDFKVAYDRLQPWLDPKGKAIVATLPR